MTTSQTSPSQSPKRHEEIHQNPAPPPDPPNDHGHVGLTFTLTSSQDDINMGEDLLTQEQIEPQLGYKSGMSPHSVANRNNTKASNDTVGVAPTVTNDTGWIQVGNVSKRKQSAITANAIDDTNYQVKQRIHNRGEEAIEEA